MKLEDTNIYIDIDEEFARSDEETKTEMGDRSIFKNFAGLLSLEFQGDFFFFFF